MVMNQVMWANGDLGIDSVESDLEKNGWCDLGVVAGSVQDKLAKAMRPGGSRARSAVVFVQVENTSPYLKVDALGKKGSFLIKGNGLAWLASGVAEIVDPKRQPERAREAHPGLRMQGLIAVEIQAAKDEPLLKRVPLSDGL